MTKPRNVRAVWLGRAAYAPVHDLQHQLQEARKNDLLGDTVLFVEHEPTITLGRGAKPEHLLVPEAKLADAGITVVATGRGGELTLHAPGQLVCYPILDLSPARQDVRRYVKDLSRVMLGLAQSYGISSGLIEKYVGLWADQARPREWLGSDAASTPVKLGAIGVRVSRWVTMHGFALNVTTDLSLFRLIIPCGITEFGVGSIESLTGERPSVHEAAERSLPIFCEVFDFPQTELETLGVSDLSAELSAANKLRVLAAAAPSTPA